MEAILSRLANVERPHTQSMQMNFVSEIRHEAGLRGRTRKLVDAQLSIRSDVASHQLRRLINAVRDLNFDAVRALIREGADVNFVVEGASPPICEALKSPYYENEAGDWVDDTPWAMAYNDMVTLLQGAGASLVTRDPEGWTVLHMAAFHRDLALVEAALAAGADVNAVDLRGRTPLHYAFLDGGDQDVAQRIVDAGANVNAMDRNGRTPLFYARYAHTDPISTTFLTDAGAYELPIAGEADDVGKVHDVDAVRADAKTFVDQTDSKGKTALHYAVMNPARPHVVYALLAMGTNVNAADKKGMTPLHPALCVPDNEDIVRLLLSFSPNTQMKNKRGNTPLFYASRMRVSAELLRELSVHKSAKY